MRILVIEDEKCLADIVADHLKKAGYLVDVSYDGEDGYFDACTGVYDLIILDIMLPGMNGLDILNELKRKQTKSKIIMLTAVATVKDKIAGLEGGANDYLAKPFHMDELMARVKVQLRQDIGQEYRLTFGDLCLDLQDMKLKCGEKEIQLSAKELRILELFMRDPERVFAQEYIYGKVWGVDSDVESNSLEAYISFIRKKLKVLNSHVKVISRRGVGYKILEDHE